MVDFVDAVAGDAFRTRGRSSSGSRYRRTRVALFRDGIQSACGFAQSATGPFYCPEDRQVYLDLGFFQQAVAKRIECARRLRSGAVIATSSGITYRICSGWTFCARVGRSPAQVHQKIIALRVAGRLLCRDLGSCGLREQTGPGGTRRAQSSARRGRSAARGVSHRNDRLQKMATVRHARSLHTRHVRSAARVESLGEGWTRAIRVRRSPRRR